jgi:hypothetical protein
MRHGGTFKSDSVENILTSLTINFLVALTNIEVVEKNLLGWYLKICFSSGF